MIKMIIKIEVLSKGRKIYGIVSRFTKLKDMKIVEKKEKGYAIIDRGVDDGERRKINPGDKEY